MENPSLPSAPPAGPARYGLILLAVALAALGILVSLHLPAFEADSAIHAEGLDDAYISYRYAANLLAGQGLVFNPGERIEGFSNLLWVLAAAGLLTFCPPQSLHLAICLLSTLLAIGSLLVFHGEMRRRSGDFVALVAAGLWAFYPFLWISIGSGLETVAVVLLQLLVWRSLSRGGERPEWKALFAFFSLIVLLRADGFVLVLLAAGHFLANSQPRRALRALLLGAPATAALFAFRLFYYRDLWPSTYYVKVTHGLFERIASAFGQLGWLLADFLLAPFLAALLWLLWSSLARMRPSGAPKEAAGLPLLPPELTLGGGLLAYWLYVGGDVFEIRFLLVLIPFGLAAAFGGFARGLGRQYAASLAVALLSGYAMMISLRPDFTWRSPRYDAWINLGQFFASRYPGALIAADGVGKIGYYSGLHTIDMLGLCDAHISKLPPANKIRPGHDKSDPAYVLARRPDLIAGHLGPDMMLSPDMTREAYTAAGYRIAYLLNTRPEGGRQSIVKAPPAGPDIAMLAAGYRYAVLAREDRP
jgi:arabinofuranosyltransferase